MKDWQGRDLAHLWHPCSQMKDYEAFPPVVIRKGRGVWLEDMDGQRYLDAVSSWWVNLFGHGHPGIGEAISEQLQNLEHVIFANFSHEPAIRLAEELMAVVPEGLNRLFFTDNGSSAVEAALKMSFQYHQQSGNTGKTRFVSLADGYHGETLGALSVGGMDLYGSIYRPLMMETVRVTGPDCFRCPYGLSREGCEAPCFQNMEQHLQQRHQELAAVIVEPMVQCAGGMKMYPPSYLKQLRRACDQYGVHLIADEIAVGFGRTGRMFALEHAGVSPDLLCLSKGLTGGYVPMAVVLATETIYEGFYDDYASGRAFLHSHSYSGNPVGCAAALAVLKQFRERDVLAGNLRTAERILSETRAHLQHLPQVGEVRQLGMITAIELVRDPETKTPFPTELRLGYRIYRRAVKNGLLLRPLGDVLYFMPPYCISEDEIRFMVQTASEAIRGELEKRQE